MGVWVPKVGDPKSKSFGCRISEKLQNDLNKAREAANTVGKRLDVSGTVTRALRGLVLKAEREIAEIKKERLPRKEDDVGVEEPTDPVDQNSHVAIPDHNAT